MLTTIPVVLNWCYGMLEIAEPAYIIELVIDIWSKYLIILHHGMFGSVAAQSYKFLPQTFWRPRYLNITLTLPMSLFLYWSRCKPPAVFAFKYLCNKLCLVISIHKVYFGKGTRARTADGTLFQDVEYFNYPVFITSKSSILQLNRINQMIFSCEKVSWCYHTM